MTDVSTKSNGWRRFRKNVSTAGNMAQMLVSGLERRVRLYYNMYTPENYPTKQSMYVNLGYWAPGCTDLDAANEALAEALGEAAGMRAGDQVLDVGFGYADQDMHWLETRKPERIVGLNITRQQVRVAQKRAQARGLGDRLDLRVGSATRMPFEAQTFDRVVSLEAAMHFKTRRDFFQEAFRVLRPGGVLATTDEVPLRLRGDDELTKEERHFHRIRLFVMPAENWYTRETYADQLREIGFVDVEVTPITDHVYEPLLGYLTRAKEALAGRDTPDDRHQRLVLTRHVEAIERKLAEPLEYVLASATKPA